MKPSKEQTIDEMIQSLKETLELIKQYNCRLDVVEGKLKRMEILSNRLVNDETK